MNSKKTEVDFETKNGRTLSRRTDYYENGQIAATGLYGSGLNHWAWDIPIGKIKHYYDNGQLKSEENYDDQGAKDGEFSHYDKRGKLVLKVTYKSDKKIKEVDYLAIEKEEAEKNIYIPPKGQ